MAVCLGEETGGAVPWVPGDPCPGLILVEHKDLQPNPLVLSMEEGALISAAVAGVWLLAWSFKAIRSVLKEHNND